jgi:predicted small secreted protein
MKKVAVTVAVLALGLAACEAQNQDNAVGNEANVEEAADADTIVATNDAEMAAENALDTASNAIENAGKAVENAGEVVANQGEAHEGNSH